MYLSADDARSDFFLAAAAYVIGPSLFALLVRATPGLLGGTAGVVLLSIVVPFLCTAAMPIFLLRHREESLAGLRTGGTRSLTTGLAVGAPVAVGVGLGEILGGGLLAGVAPGLLALVAVVVRWASLAILAVFLWRRAEYAFRPVSERQSDLTRKAGLAAGGTVVIGTVLLLLAGQPIWSLLGALGVAGVVLLAERLVPQEGIGERWWAWAPPLTLALGPLEIFGIFFGGAQFLASAQQAGAVAVFGLAAVMALHARRGALAAFGLALAFGLSNLLAFGGATRFFV